MNGLNNICKRNSSLRQLKNNKTMKLMKLIRCEDFKKIDDEEDFYDNLRAFQINLKLGFINIQMNNYLYRFKLDMTKTLVSRYDGFAFGDNKSYIRYINNKVVIHVNDLFYVLPQIQASFNIARVYKNLDFDLDFDVSRQDVDDLLNSNIPFECCVMQLWIDLLKEDKIEYDSIETITRDNYFTKIMNMTYLDGFRDKLYIQIKCPNNTYGIMMNIDGFKVDDDIIEIEDYGDGIQLLKISKNGFHFDNEDEIEYFLPEDVDYDDVKDIPGVNKSVPIELMESDFITLKRNYLEYNSDVIPPLVNKVTTNNEPIVEIILHKQNKSGFYNN